MSEKNFQLINRENTITERHLNGSKLRLNKRGTTVLSNNFIEAISNYFTDNLLYIPSLTVKVVVGLLVMNIRLRDR